jgi:predicted  nucleic acid-binding Zn ribbon protein
LTEHSAEDAYNQMKKVLLEKANLLRDFSDELKENREKMFKELELFDSANEASYMVRPVLQEKNSLFDKKNNASIYPALG